MNINIRTIPHKDQRYPTVGDWYWAETRSGRKPILHIDVSEMGDWRFEALVAIHELVEVLKCKHDGVTQEEVDKFDIAFENNRKKGNEDEPGDDPKAPYQMQHCLATGIERIMAAELGVKWEDYAVAVESLQ